MSRTKFRWLLLGWVVLPLQAAGPLVCPAGAPLDSFRISVSQPDGVSRDSRGLQLQTANQLLPGEKISFTPAKSESAGSNSSQNRASHDKKARIALVLVPSDHGKIVVLDPKPANEPTNWILPSRTEIVALVYGPQGLDTHRIGDLVKKNGEIIGQLADYAAKTQETQSLIQAITQQQQTLATGQSVNSAVVSFANQFPGAPQLDAAQPANAQMLTLIRSVNPSIAAYDPLAQSPAQRAAQSAGLAAAVAGLFFGTNVALAASGGALLVNMHSLLFPGTEFRSAFAQMAPEHKEAQTSPGPDAETLLCGNKMPSASHTELAFLWATRVPDAPAPAITIPRTEHLPIGLKSSFPIAVKAREWSLAARVQNWRLISEADEKDTIPVTAKVNTQTKTIEIDAENKKLKPGTWKLAGDWDWSSLSAGALDLRPLSGFEQAHLTPESQDRLTQAAGKIDVNLEGGDFEFVEKLAYKRSDDKFAEAVPLPFRLPEGPRAGPESTLETQLEAESLAAGNYRFEIAQSDGKTHEVPFKVLPAPPKIANLPLLAHTGGGSEHIVLHGTGLDRIEALSATGAQITLGEAKKGDEREVDIQLSPEVTKDAKITLQMKVADFEEPIGLTDALLVAGPRPSIARVRSSLPADAGIALAPGEMPGNSFVSFALDTENVNAADVTGVRLSCSGGSAPQLVKMNPDAQGPLFLSFDPSTVGQAGCVVMASLVTASAGDSLPVKLGVIVRLPQVDSFELTAEAAGSGSFYGTLKGEGLEEIEKVGWDADTGTAVDSLPVPVAGSGTKQTLRVAVPWPAPAPHAPLYVWLRGEKTGRATSARW